MTSREALQLQAGMSKSEGDTFTNSVLAGRRKRARRAAIMRGRPIADNGSKSKKKKREETSPDESETSDPHQAHKKKKSKKRQKASTSSKKKKSKQTTSSNEERESQTERSAKKKTDQPGTSTGGTTLAGPSAKPTSKKKSLLPKEKQQRCIESRKREEKTMMREAARRSLVEQDRGKYRAQAEESDIEEERIDQVDESEEDAAQDNMYESEEDGEEDDLPDDRELLTDNDIANMLGMVDDYESAEDYTYDPDNDDGVDEDDLDEGEEDEQDEVDEDDPQPQQQTTKRVRQRKIVEPGPDANPDGPSALPPSGEPPNTNWTSRLSKVPTHDFIGCSEERPPGPTFPKLQRPVDYFLKFFPVALFIFIADMTNIKLAQMKLNPTTTEEIRAWFGIRMVMGLCILSDQDDYWSDHPGFRNALICKTMTKNRFQQISTHLACSDPNKDPKEMPSNTTKEKQDKFNYIRSHPLFYFRTVWDTVLSSCRRNYNCLKHLAIDEAMVPYSREFG